MTIVRSEFLLISASAAALVALGSVATTLWSAAVSIEPIPGRHETSNVAAAQIRPPIIALTQFSASETLRRPVFSPTRRPVEPASASPLPPAQPQPLPEPIDLAAKPDQLRLHGIMIAAEDARALVRSPAYQNGRWHRSGAAFDGWTITRITEQAITIITAAGRTVELKLYVDKPAE